MSTSISTSTDHLSELSLAEHKKIKNINMQRNGGALLTSTIPNGQSNNKEKQEKNYRSSHSGTFMKLKTYLHALRPWSLSASLVPTLLGSALAYRSQWSSDFSFITFLLTIFTVVTVHCAGNVVNTYFDFVKGIDKQKADDRTLVDHILTQDEVSENINKLDCLI